MNLVLLVNRESLVTKAAKAILEKRAAGCRVATVTDIGKEEFSEVEIAGVEKAAQARCVFQAI